MSALSKEATGPEVSRGRFRFGLRGLLASVLTFAVVFGWIGCENRRAQQQSMLVADLVGVGVQPDLEEPTALGFFIKKRFPVQEAWVRERIGGGWLSRPTVFLCSKLTDEHVPYAIDRLKRLGSVREIHYQSRGLSDRGIDQIQSSLPGVGVVPRSNPALQRYYIAQVRGAHFALGGFLLEAAFAVVLLGGLATIIWFLRSLTGRRESGAHTPMLLSGPPEIRGD
jgi:hypothetical protein